MYALVKYPKHINLDYEVIEEDLFEKTYKIPTSEEYGCEIPEGGILIQINSKPVFESIG